MKHEAVLSLLGENIGIPIFILFIDWIKNMHSYCCKPFKIVGYYICSSSKRYAATALLIPLLNPLGSLVIFVYLSSLPVAHLSNAARRRLVVMGDSARIQDETTENSAWFFNVLGV